MQIKEYNSRDREQILSMGRRSKRREAKIDAVEKLKPFYCFVAEEDSKIYGFVIMESLGDNVSYYMVQINVLEKRRGIGSLLVNKLFEYAGPGGHISLNVNTDNTSARQFYESLGFKISG